MSARVHGVWSGYPASGDSIAAAPDDERAEGQLWERLAESHPLVLTVEAEPDYDLIRKQQVEAQIAWGNEL